MTRPLHIDIISRRHLLLSVACGAILSSLFPRSLHGASELEPQSTHQESDPNESNGWQKTLEALTKGATPSRRKITLSLPDIADNGSIIPFTVTIDSPMSAEDHVDVLHLISTGNSFPDIASFFFSPLNGKASVTSRIRLAKSQDIIALAHTSTDKVYLAEQKIRVRVGG